MVLQPAGPDRAGSRPQLPRPDASRIAGISGTLVFNLFVFMLLLVPMSQPELLRIMSDPEPIPDWITKKPKPPEKPPVEVKVVRPSTPVRPDRTVPVPTPPIVDEVIVDEGTLPAAPVIDLPPVTNAVASIEPAGPIAGIRLEYGDAPAPTYPREQLLAGIQGTVLLQVLVDVDGRPLEVSIHRSSGNRQLDDAARRQVLRKWSFRPAMKDGRAVQAIGIVPIDFNLGQ